MSKPLIFEIKGNSLDDGPGIRSVVFFKGCPLSCLWCHNPEGMRREQQISWDATKCLACDSCIEVCTENALSREQEGFVDRERCTLCFDCEDACPSGAMARIGRQMSVDDVFAQIQKDIPFFQNSGGGVTLSGGEPTLFPEFAGELAARLKDLDVHVLLETCGLFSKERFDELIYPHLDNIYFDIKVMDADHHREVCGTDNAQILENFRTLHERSVQGGVGVLPRIPLIPGMTADDANLAAIAAFLRGLGANRVALLPYHSLWESKLANLGKKLPPAFAQKQTGAMLAQTEIDRCKGHFAKFDILT